MNRPPSSLRHRAEDVYYRARDRWALTTPLQRANLMLNLYERRFNIARPISYPNRLQVEVTNRCNLECFICSPREGLGMGDIGPDAIDRICECSKYISELVLFGFGEPLLSKAFYAMIKRVESGSISFFTNGVALKPKVLDEILSTSARPIQRITFSLDGATAETYDSIRKGASFTKVVENLRYLHQVKKRMGWRFPRIHISFVAMKRNIRELPALVELAAETGVSAIQISHLVVYEDDYVSESLLHTPELADEFFAKAAKAARQKEILLDLPTALEPGGCRGDRGKGKLPNCYSPWRFPYVTFQGDVLACCYAPSLVMGNLGKDSFYRIWRGEKFEALRKRVNVKPNGVCLQCESRYKYTPTYDPAKVFLKMKPRESQDRKQGAQG